MNHLANETSLYLRQHASNPVEWYPWGDAALSKAKAENKPIFLSIGYSACHWCHVMEHESFVDPDIATMLNEHFINIKVDREERPDIDNIYMNATLALNGHGGWPMSVFLTPDLQPFHAGTYYPPEPRYQMPSFRQLLTAVINGWRDKREMLVQQAQNVTNAVVEHVSREVTGNVELGENLLRGAGTMLNKAHDMRHGGFGSAPKFMHTLDLRLLLRLSARFNDEDAKQIVLFTLDNMARGGIYDQIAGGFHRYSTDARWLVPHFEKMLYDNALLVPVYLEAFQSTGNQEFLRTAEETLSWVEREMTSPSGGFYSTTDADSEGVEGKFFVWSQAECNEVLGEDADFAAGVFDITQAGNWEGHNILNRPKTLHQELVLNKISEKEFHDRLARIKMKLLAAREKRIKPNRDEKILAAWNGLMIAAYAQAAQVTGNKHYADMASWASDFVLTRMRQVDGRLYRATLENGQAKLNAYLEDYAYVIDGLLHLVETTWQPRWLQAARELADIMIKQFWDASSPGFFFTGNDHESLIYREKQINDNATPSGNSVAVTVLLRLARITGDNRYLPYVEKVLRHYAPLMEKQPMALGQLFLTLDDWLGPVDEYAILPGIQADDAEAALRLLHRKYMPRKLVVGPPLKIPLLEHRNAVDDQVTIYHCVNQTCEQPWVGVQQITSNLN
ncbi:MAG: thioredoxin domain-containing protein [Planctomycetia bacterium]|nr:thioredoxin domain-containing protein [Planctomycetia bacterium]